MKTPHALTMAAVCLLLGCAAGPPPTPASELSQPLKVQPNASLLTPPPPLPPPRSGQLKDLEANHREVARRYHQVASQLCQLIDYVVGPVDGCPLIPPNPLRKSRDDE